MFPWWPVALQELGEAEVAGAEHNERVLEYFKATNFETNEDETPWCSAFASWCMQQYGGLRTAWARNWLKWGREARAQDLQLGAVVILERGTSNGHVGFLQRIEWEPDGLTMKAVWILGGNQGNAVSIRRFQAERVLGIRVPN